MCDMFHMFESVWPTVKSVLSRLVVHVTFVFISRTSSVLICASDVRCEFLQSAHQS